jgi:tetratricopeptide (TPR) repeat protein
MADKFIRLIQNRNFQILAIVTLSLLLYGRVLNFEYIGLDDTWLIVENQAFLEDASNIPQAFHQDVFKTPYRKSKKVYYRPLLTLSFMLDAHVGKTNPKVYHFTNIILHILSCLLILGFFRMLNMKSETAFVLTLAFSVHPILSQAIAWIPGRNDVLLSIFILSGMICLIKYLKDFRIPYLLLHFLFFGMALFTKESAIVFPLFGLGYSVLLLKRKIFSKDHLVLILGYLAVIIFWTLLRESALSEQQRGLISGADLWTNFLYNLPLLLQYISKIFIPYKLSTLSTAQDTNYLMGLTVTFFLCLGILLSKNKNWNKIAFGSFWFLLFLLPSFVTPRVTGMEHRVYLPLVGLLIVCSELSFMKKLSFQKTTSLAVIPLIFLLITVNVMHTGVFKNLLNFWKSAAENTTHSALAFLNYGAALYEKGKDDAAIQSYKRGIEIDPRQPWIHNNLGLVYLKKKMYPQAEAEFFEELKYHPDYSDVFYNLGLLYKGMGLRTKATRMWERALTLNPNNQDAKDELAGRNTSPGKRRYLSDTK